MTTSNKHISEQHFTFSDNFFQLVQNVLTETIANNNIDIYVGRPRDDIREHYRQLTKWSDFRVFIPVLFNFFHGLELLLKGANYKIGLPAKDPNHKLSDHLKQFSINYPMASPMLDILNKYIFPTSEKCILLRDFYDLNRITDSSKFYDVFKYPTDKSFKTSFNYRDLRNLGDEGIEFFKQIIADIETLRLESEKL